MDGATFSSVARVKDIPRTRRTTDALARRHALPTSMSTLYGKDRMRSI